MFAADTNGLRILVVRLGAMGDIIHALPAAATLKHSFPRCHLTWIVESKWAALLEGNPFLDAVIRLERGSLAGWLAARRELRRGFDIVVDFQGLLKSALVAAMSRADRICGFHQSQARERLAGLFYSNKTLAHAAHVVDRNLELAAAAGASNVVTAFPLPPGTAEGELPDGPFVLACPLAGWVSKQWPLDYYAALARRLKDELGCELVVNGPPQAEPLLARARDAVLHFSGVPGLIHATRRAAAVVGIDSGPLHLAAALSKPGVAIFGPTDPARNGPYGHTMTVLRSAGAATTYKRRNETDHSMRDITPDAVFDALKTRMLCGSSV